MGGDINVNKATLTTEDQVAQFFKYVGYGRQEEAEAILKSKPKLAVVFNQKPMSHVSGKT